MSIQIQCVTPDGADADYRLDGIGGTNADGGTWRLTIDDAIAGIKSGKWTFHTGDTLLTRAKVVRKISDTGREYLTTEPDNLTSNNLSNLPKCM